MTQIRLALGGSASVPAVKLWAERYPSSKVSVLVSYAYEHFLVRGQANLYAREWALDSGAFTAHSSGKPIENRAYIDACLRYMAAPSPPADIFGLDVIGGDWRATVRNVEEAWRRGVPAIPTWHFGEPIDLAVSMARDYPKIAIGGIARMRGLENRSRIIGQVFARVWPKRIHGFGISHEPLLMRFPFHTSDASSWELDAMRFGNWHGFGARPSHFPEVRKAYEGLVSQIRHFMQIEKRVAARWRGEMALLCEPAHDASSSMPRTG